MAQRLGEITSKRTGGQEFEIPIDGEVYTVKPPKKSKAVLALFLPDRGDGNENILASRELLSWFEKALDPRHGKTKKQPGHGEESVEGCQACRIYDRLNDDDDDLELDSLFEAANALQAAMGDRPTSS